LKPQWFRGFFLSNNFQTEEGRFLKKPHKKPHGVKK